jgi:hypothetical protein
MAMSTLRGRVLATGLVLAATLRADGLGGGGGGPRIRRRRVLLGLVFRLRSGLRAAIQRPTGLSASPETDAVLTGVEQELKDHAITPGVTVRQLSRPAPSVSELTAG